MIKICKKNQSKVNLFKIQRILKLELIMNWLWNLFIAFDLIGCDENYDVKDKVLIKKKRKHDISDY